MSIMSYSAEFGNIREETETKHCVKNTFSWVIKNFRSYSREVGQYDTSPNFFTGPNKKYQWRLEIGMCGFDKYSSNYVGIGACLVNETHHKNTQFTIIFYLLDKDGDRSSTESVLVEDGEGCIYRFILRKVLLEKDELLPNGELRLICEIFNLSDADVKSPTSINEIQQSQSALQTGCKKLLDSKKFSDFKLVVKGKEFFVHRAILGSQSSVFEAMFESSMRETADGKVDIDDIEPDVIEKLLRFVYTGEIDFGKSTDQILIAADKYDLNELKRLCEDSIAQKLNVDNVYRTLQLADKYNAYGLKKKAMAFFDQNMQKLVKAEDFKASVHSLSKDVLTDIIHACALKRCIVISFD